MSMEAWTTLSVIIYAHNDGLTEARTDELVLLCVHS